MRKKVLGRTGLEVPILGLGTGSLGLHNQNDAVLQYAVGPNFGVYTDENLAVQTVLEALDLGVFLIDTAPWYGRGASERAIGIALKERPALREKVILGTKIGHLHPTDGYDFSYDAAMRSFEESQKRLGVEMLSIVYLHDPMGQHIEKVMGRGGVFEAMRELQKEGRIKFLGIGANSPVTAAEYIATGGFDVAIAVASWSLINQSARSHIIPSAEKWNTGLIAANALERGILATGFQKNLIYQERRFDKELIARIQKMKEICDHYGIPLNAAAVQWCVRNDNFAAAIPGARTPDQIQENVHAAETEIPEKFWNDFDPLVKTWDCVVP